MQIKEDVDDSLQKQSQDKIDLLNMGHEGLMARVNALRIAALEFHEGVAGAFDAVRRIIRSLHNPHWSRHYPEVAAIGTILGGVEEADLEENIAKYMPILRGLALGHEDKKIGILCVEDDAVARQILKHRLVAINRHIHMADTLLEAQRILSENEISLVLLDLNLPDGDGRDLLLQLRETPATATIPVIVISGKDGHQAQTECLALGADNFIPKPINPVTISAVVSAELHRATETQRRSSQDQLTSVPHRAAFSNALLRAAQLASRAHQPLVVSLLGIDDFAAINELHGRSVGDEVLQWLAKSVNQSLRASDFLARWGGAEFAVLLPNTTQQNTQLVLNKALAEFSAKQFSGKDGALFNVSFSAGMALVDAKAPISQAMEEAGLQLSKAKTAGQGSVYGV